jgi:hypothetical protein
MSSHELSVENITIPDGERPSVQGLDKPIIMNQTKENGLTDIQKPKREQSPNIGITFLISTSEISNYTT